MTVTNAPKSSMSKQETKMTRWYAQTRYPKGFLMEEYLALPQGKTNGKRLMDGASASGSCS